MATKISGAETGASGDFLSWWIDELTSALPGRVRRRSRAPRQSLILRRRSGDVLELFRHKGRALTRLGQLELPPPLPATLGEAADAHVLPYESRRLVEFLGRRSVPAVYLLEHEEGLLCPDLLPAGAENDVERIMPHRVDMLTPWPAGRVHAGHKVLGRRKDGQVDVLLGVAPKAAVDPTLARLAAYGVRVDAVDILDEGGDPSGLNLLAERGPRRGARRWVVIGLAALALLAVGAAFAGLDAWQVRGQLQARERYADGLDRRLADLPQLRAAIDALKKDAGFIPAQQRRTPSPTVVLEVISRLLPDSVWLDAVSLEGDEVNLSGYAEDAAQVLPIIESSPHFREAQFRAPSTRVSVPGPGGGTRDVERFSLSARVEPSGDPEP